MPVLSATVTTVESNPAVSDARSPIRIIDLPVNSSEVTAALSEPGATLIKLAFNFSTPMESFVATALTFRARLRTCLLIRKKTIGDSSSGSNPISTT